MNQTTIILVGEDARMWAMMQALRDLGCFTIRYGSFEVNIDGDGKISNVKIQQNYRIPKLTTE